MKRFNVVFFLALLLAPVAAASAQSAADGSAAALAIRSGDFVKLDVWREPEFSGEYQVDEAGYVTLPRLGRVQATAFTPVTLQEELISQFSQYLRNPSINITVLRRIRITGEVQTPGLYPVDPTMTVADAVAMAGGVTPLGDGNNVQLWRDGVMVTTGLTVSTAIGESPIRSGDQIMVPERSWISRNTNVIAAGIGAAASLIIALFLR